MTCLELNNVTKRYKQFCLDHVSFSVPSGSIMGFIGENGAGKTTTIKAILNLVHTDEGSVKIFGLDVHKNEKEIKEQIGVVLDDSFFHDTLRIIDIERIMEKVYGHWNSQMFDYYLKKFQLPTKKVLKEFSRGMKMKLSIAIALSHEAKLLILDEATSGLDPVIRNEILDVFLEFIQDEEHTIFVSSHITGDLERIADYITFIHDGKVVLSKPKDDLLDEYGVVKCGEAEFDKMASEDVVGYRKNAYGYEVLVKDKKKAAKLFQHMVIDPVKLEDIMFFYAKGEKKC